MGLYSYVPLELTYKEEPQANMGHTSAQAVLKYQWMVPDGTLVPASEDLHFRSTNTPTGSQLVSEVKTAGKIRLPGFLVFTREPAHL